MMQLSPRFRNVKRKCDRCGSLVAKQKVASDEKAKSHLFPSKYLSIGESKQSNVKSQQMGEPILLNPNSYNNLSVILDSLKTNLDIGNSRQRSFIGCDGPSLLGKSYS